MVNEILVKTFGYIGTFLFTVSEIPQVYKIVKTKEVEAISDFMMWSYSIGAANMLTYGIFIDSIPLIVTNSNTLFLSLLILFLKKKYSKHNNINPEENPA